MPTFAYRAYNSTGTQVKGRIDASGSREAVQALKNTGLYPTEVAQERAARARGLLAPRVGAPALAAFTRQLATLLSTGSSLTEALSVLAENTSNQKLRASVLNVKESISGGSSLAKALDEHPDIFSPMYRGLVAAAEASGSLDSVLPRLADHLEKRARITADVRTALAYPALMTIVGASVLLFLFIFVIPRIARIFEETGARLPLITRALLWSAEAASSYWPVLLAVAGAGAWAAARRLRSERGRELRDRLLLALPWFGQIASSFHVANLTRTLGTLLKGGVQLLSALEITAEAVDNQVFRKLLKEAAEDCAGGKPLSAGLKSSGVIPPVVVHMVGVGERSGRLDEMLLRTADACDAEFESGVKKTMGLLEPALILAMGAVVGFIVLAMLLPIFELNQIIR